MNEIGDIFLATPNFCDPQHIPTAIELHFLHEFINKATSIKITTCMRMLRKSKGK